jgi:hypothetical protein
MREPTGIYPHSNNAQHARPPLAENEKPQRKHPAHGVFMYSGTPTIVFLTVCTKDRTT